MIENLIFFDWVLVLVFMINLFMLFILLWVEVEENELVGVGLIVNWVVFWRINFLVCDVFILDIILGFFVGIFFIIIDLEFVICMIFSSMVLNFEVEIFCFFFCLSFNCVWLDLFFMIVLKELLVR